MRPTWDVCTWGRFGEINLSFFFQNPEKISFILFESDLDKTIRTCTHVPADMCIRTIRFTEVTNTDWKRYILPSASWKLQGRPGT